MSIDSTGTTPGLAPGVQVQPKTINMKCRDPNCTSIEATEIQLVEPSRSAPMPSQRVYRCVKCGRPHSVSVGGYASF
jgi:DNA-directed RNA polymerase subunit M/transcription elongation factor TFIIS